MSAAPLSMIERQRLRWAISRLDAKPSEQRIIDALLDHFMWGAECSPGDRRLLEIANVKDPRAAQRARAKAIEAGILVAHVSPGRPNRYEFRIPAASKAAIPDPTPGQLAPGSGDRGSEDTHGQIAFDPRSNEATTPGQTGTSLSLEGSLKDPETNAREGLVTPPAPEPASQPPAPPVVVCPPDYPDSPMQRPDNPTREGAAQWVFDECLRLREKQAPNSGRGGMQPTDAIALLQWVHDNLRGEDPLPVECSWRGLGHFTADVLTFAMDTWRADNGSLRPLFRFIGAGQHGDYPTFRKFFEQWKDHDMPKSAKTIREVNWGYLGGRASA